MTDMGVLFAVFSAMMLIEAAYTRFAMVLAYRQNTNLNAGWRADFESLKSALVRLRDENESLVAANGRLQLDVNECRACFAAARRESKEQR